jgi:hypothetical protein
LFFEERKYVSKSNRNGLRKKAEGLNGILERTHGLLHYYALKGG